MNSLGKSLVVFVLALSMTGAVAAEQGVQLLAVPGLCAVHRVGSRLMIESKGPVVEWSMLEGATCSQGEVAGGGSLSLPLPHYRTFILAVARPALGKMGVIIGRENDGHLGYKSYLGGPFSFLLVPGLGHADVVSQGGRLYLHIHCAAPGRTPVEYSFLSGSEYRQSEAGGWARPEFTPPDKYEPLPHYETFVLVMARYEEIGIMIARENDGKVGAIILP